MPNPSRQNGLKYQPGTFRHFPTLVVEIAIMNEDRERLLADADQKYFNANTSVQAWIGIKIDQTSNTFWAGWGRRALVGYGLRLEQQTEDEAGNSSFQPIYPWLATNLVGQFSIPSDLILYPNPVPANIPGNLVITLEEIRSSIEFSIDLM